MLQSETAVQPARASLISVSVSILPEAGSDRQTCQAFLGPSGAEPRCSLIGRRIPPTCDKRIHWLYMYRKSIDFHNFFEGQARGYLNI